MSTSGLTSAHPVHCQESSAEPDPTDSMNRWGSKQEGCKSLLCKGLRMFDINKDSGFKSAWGGTLYICTGMLCARVSEQYPIACFHPFRKSRASPHGTLLKQMMLQHILNATECFFCFFNVTSASWSWCVPPSLRKRSKVTLFRISAEVDACQDKPGSGEGSADHLLRLAQFIGQSENLHYFN